MWRPSSLDDEIARLLRERALGQRRDVAAEHQQRQCPASAFLIAVASADAPVMFCVDADG